MASQHVTQLYIGEEQHMRPNEDLGVLTVAPVVFSVRGIYRVPQR